MDAPGEIEQPFNLLAPDDLFDQVADVCAAACNPETDIRGSADYKRAVVRTYVRRGLDEALTDAQS